MAAANMGEKIVTILSSQSDSRGASIVAYAAARELGARQTGVRDPW